MNHECWGGSCRIAQCKFVGKCTASRLQLSAKLGVNAAGSHGAMALYLTRYLMCRRLAFRNRRPPSQGWKAFLRNHADGIASLDLSVIPTISFQLLYGLLILKHVRREILCLVATAHPSAEWISRQLTEAYGWEEGPLSRPRSGQRLWRGLHPAPSCDGYSRSAGRATVTMAEWLL
jgi:hypothetical protein